MENNRFFIIKKNKVLESLTIISVEKEDQVFQQLSEFNKYYTQQRLEYDAMPDPNKVKTPREITLDIGGTEPDDVFPLTTVTVMGESHNQAGDSYNFNSYVNGILSVAKIGLLGDSTLNYDHPGLDPGRDHVISQKYFETPNSKKNAATQEN